MQGSRITILVVAIGLFVLIWTHADHPSHSTLPSEPVHEPGDVFVDKGPETVTVQSDSNTAGDPLSLPGPWMFAPELPELPPAITPGEYRAVNQKGEVSRYTISAGDLAGRDPAVMEAVDHYELQTETDHWYFIRIDAAEHEPASQVLTQADLPGAGESGRFPLLRRLKQRLDAGRFVRANQPLQLEHP